MRTVGRKCRAVAIALAAGLPVLAASGGLSSPDLSLPLLGYLQTGPGELRPIIGIAGATQLGGPMAVPAGTTRISVSPAQNFVLVDQEGHGELRFAALKGTTAEEWHALAGTAASSRIIFSPTGLSAGLVSGGQLHVWTGFPHSVRLAFESTLPEGARALAVNDAGTMALFQEQDGRVLLISESVAPQLVWSDAGSAVMEFLPGRDTAAAYGSAARQLVLLQGLGGDLSTRVLAANLDAIGETALLRTSASRILLAGAGQHEVASIAMDAAGVEWIASSAPVTMFQGLLSSGQTLVSAEEGESAWVLDASGSQPKIYFVPRIFLTEAEAQ